MLFSKILSVLIEYCENSTLAGVSYILERRFVADGVFDTEINEPNFNYSFHYTERLFWLVCVLATSICAVYVTLQYLELFETNAVTIVVERWKPYELVQFPAVVICENGQLAGKYPGLQKVMDKFALKDDQNKFDVEEFILQLVFVNLYNPKEFETLCENQCKNCTKCPDKHYQEITETVLANCSTLFEACIWKKESFNCCTYFKPMQTSIGKCYAMNSLHSNNDGQYKQQKMEFPWKKGSGILNITINRAAMLYILNEEDIPETLIARTNKAIMTPGIGHKINIQLTDISSDQNVRRVLPKYRKCLFPDEVPKDYPYKYYSSSVCITEYIRQVQLKGCNCTSHNILGNESLVCSLEGYICLDNKEIFYPMTHQNLAAILNESHECLPSCNERMIHVSQLYEKFPLNDENSRRFELTMLPMAMYHYKRQSVRTYLDIFVSIGGILGLFTGASVLSGVEIVYYFIWKMSKVLLNIRNY